MAAPFTVTKHADTAGVARLAVTGDVEMSTSDALSTIIINAIAIHRTAELIIDLDQVTFLDSAGIAALIAGRDAALDHGTTYRVVNARGVVRQILDMAGVLGTLTGAPPEPPS